MGWVGKREISIFSLSQLNSRWRCITSIRFIGPWWMSPCVISLLLILSPISSSFLYFSFYLLLMCVWWCVCVCVMKRETLGRRILTSETQPVRRNSPIWWPCAPSLFFSLCGRWVFFLLLLLLSVGRLKIAPLNKIIITFHITKRVKIKFWKIQIQKKNPPIHWNVAMKTGKEEYKNQEKNWLLKNYPQKI